MISRLLRKRRERKAKDEAKDRVTSVSLEELYREYRREAYAPWAAYHTPPRPPARRAG